MNWNQLQYMVTVAQEKSITKAAQKLYISQPSLSLSMQSLEKETGVTLFERMRGEVVLTYAGTLFYEWAVATLHSQSQLVLKLNDISMDRRSSIQLGMSPHRSLTVLPRVLERFYADCPNCEVHIMEKPTYVLKKLLEENKIDCMIDVMHPDTMNYQSDLLTEEKIILAVPSSFAEMLPCREAEAVSLAVLTSCPFIMLSSEQILGNMSRKMCESASFYPNIRILCENVETALALVNQQLGISFVPEILAKQPQQTKRFPHVRYYPVQQFCDTRQLCLVYHKNRYHHVHFVHLLQLFREMVPQLYQV